MAASSPPLCPARGSPLDVYVLHAYSGAVQFEWDEQKEARNIRVHGVDFGEARTAFYDPLALIRADPEHSQREARFILMGRSTTRRLLVTIFTERGETTRIISSRCAAPREVRDYEKGI